MTSLWKESLTVRLALAALVASALGSTMVQADIVPFTHTYEGSFAGDFDGDTLDLEVRAIFDLAADGTLTVTLENIASTAPAVPSALLTGLFWDAPDATITAVSAVLGTNGGFLNFTEPGGNAGNVGGEFGFRNDLSGFLGGQEFGVSSTGMDEFGSGDLIDSSANLEDPEAPDGLNFGMAPDGFTPPGSGPLSSEPLIEGAVVFTFDVEGWLSENDLTNIAAHYGTSEDQPTIDLLCVDCTPPGGGEPVPEPATLTLLGVGLACLSYRARRKP